MGGHVFLCDMLISIGVCPSMSISLWKIFFVGFSSNIETFYISVLFLKFSNSRIHSNLLLLSNKMLFLICQLSFLFSLSHPL